MITLGIMMDLILLVQLYIFSMHGKSWRFPIAVSTIYLLRFIMVVSLCNYPNIKQQSLFQMSYPEGYIWEFPGMYSLTIQYGNQNSFYFCAYLALCVIHICEFYANQYYKLSLLSGMTAIMLMIVLIFTRGHYFIDLFGAVFFGHYFWMMSERVAWVIDYKILGIPFHKRFPNFPKKCQLCKHPINQWTNVCFSQCNGQQENTQDDKLLFKEDREFSYQFFKGKSTQ